MKLVRVELDSKSDECNHYQCKCLLQLNQASMKWLTVRHYQQVLTVVHIDSEKVPRRSGLRT